MPNKRLLLLFAFSHTSLAQVIVSARFCEGFWTYSLDIVLYVSRYYTAIMVMNHMYLCTKCFI